MNIAIIPARGGSKRIPRKNIRCFCGKPMIVYSIEQALESNLFERVIVSTEDEEIAKLSKDYGAEVPFLRPLELSDDYTSTLDVIAHAVSRLLEEYDDELMVCCVYATAPFLKGKYLKEGLETIEKGNWEYVFSAAYFESSVSRSFKKNNDESIEMFFPEKFDIRTQDMSEAMFDAAQFYWGRSNAWLNKKKIFTNQATIVEIPRWLVQDIDTEEDWKRAELMRRLLNEQS